MYTIIDIETTGNGIKGNKITEIAIFKYDGTKIVDEFTSLVNPECPIPYFITGLTGIDDQMVQKAPLFSEIAHKILEVTADCIFVAHSVNFDYGVIKEEFRKIGIEFTRKKLCTVRLSRNLIPNMASYSLGKLCSALTIQITDRHRARGDARATVTLFKKLLARPNSEKLMAKFLNSRNQEATLPPLLNKSNIDGLPQKPGIYYFKNKTGDIIYIGKAKNIKKRVLGHFYDKSLKETVMFREISSVEFELSGSELIALLMESNAIKTHFPKYNRSQKKISKTYAVFKYEDRNGFLHLAYTTTKRSPEPIKIFHRLNDCRAFLNKLCKEFGLCEKLCHLREVACNTQISKCIGACHGKVAPGEYNQRVHHAVDHIMEIDSSYYIKEPGRTADEDAFVYVADGVYSGYGFIEKNVEVNSFQDLKAFVIRQRNTVETEGIITGHLLRNLSAQVLDLPKEVVDV